MLEVPRRTKKHPQTIWLDTDVFIKVLEIAQKLGVAPNIVCSEIIRKYVESGVEPIKIVEKTIEVPAGFYCPMCVKRFKDIDELYDHLATNERCKADLKKLWGERP
ncbi:MAG: hypothetical protein QW815_09315 [Nitrososphaerota archaeon]